MTGKLVDLSMGMNRKQRITVEVNEDFEEKFLKLKDADLDIEIKKHRDRRSLNANSYYWVLITKAAKQLRISNNRAHNIMLTPYIQAVRKREMERYTKDTGDVME